MTNPYNPPTEDSPILKSGRKIGRMERYLTNQRLSVVSGGAYVMFCLGVMSVAPSTINASAGFNPVSIMLWLAMFPFFLGSSLVVKIAQALGLNFSSLFAEFAVSMIGGFVSAFAASVAIHFFIGSIFRRRKRSGMAEEPASAQVKSGPDGSA